METKPGRRREPRPYKAKRLTQWTAQLGQRVRALRLERGWTQEFAADHMEMDLKHLQKVEAGKLNVTLATLFRIADGLAMPVEQLLSTTHPAHTVVGVRKPATLETPDRVLRTVGDRVAETRLQRRWTQQRLADKVGLSLSTIEQVEAGKESVSLRSLAMLGQALAVPVAALLAPTQQIDVPRRARPRAPKTDTK